MEFEFPTRFWLLGIWCVLLAISYRRCGPLGSRGRLILTLRAIAGAVMVAALAMPFALKPTATKRLTAFLDISQSITENQGSQLLSQARELARQVNLPLSIVPFAGHASWEKVESDFEWSYKGLRAENQNLDIGYSDIYGVLSQASQSEVALLLSDGYENHTSSKDQNSFHATSPIFPLLSEGSDPKERLSISHLRVPKVVAAKKQAVIESTVSNQGDLSQVAEVAIYHGEDLLVQKSVVIAPRQDIVVSTLSKTEAEGLLPVKTVVSWADDQGKHTIERSAWLASEKREKVLLLSGEGAKSGLLKELLTDEAYQLKVTQARNSEVATDSLDDYRVIVLQNVHISELGDKVSNNLRRYVENGGGLVVVGGDSSFGLGDYIGSPLEDILPVRLVPPHKEMKRLGVAVQLVIDKSRSMITDNRLEYAKRAAQAVIATLKDDDFIGVIGFDEVPFVALPLAEVGRVRSIALSRISRLFPTSRTNLYPALEEARRSLSAVRASRKHVVVLTDGKIPDPGRYYFELVKQARFLDITLSTILVGNEADDGFLAELARRGGGAFYQTIDPSKLPKIFLSDVRFATKEKTLDEQESIPVLVGPDGLQSTEISSYPNLKGFVQTKQRKDSNTELVVRTNEGIYPLLASRKIKRGNVIAFTSDASGRWSSRWFQWSRIHQFWSEIIGAARGSLSKSRGVLTDFEARTWVEGASVVLDVALYDESADRDVTGRVELPKGDIVPVALTKISRGHYRGQIDGATAGTYKADLKAGDFTLPRFAWDVSGEVFGERTHRAPNMNFLREIAHKSGGVVNPSPEDIKRVLKYARQKRFYVWEFVLLVAFVYGLELLVRLQKSRSR
jgi:uncharacterized membrane protein